jgi:hypothetical protein
METEMPSYILFLHDNPRDFIGRSESDMMSIVKEYGAWAAKMRGENRLLGGEKLTDTGGKILSKQGGKMTVVDGPYAEAREVIGGFFTITAKDYAEAVKIAESCPHAKHGSRIEVREIQNLSGN